MFFRIPDQLLFPDPELAEPSGLLGVGGDLDPARLLLAYSQGIFPWYHTDPILWWSPNPRMVLYPKELKVSRSLGKRVRQGRFEIRVDSAFERVVERCAAVPRPGQDGTWITNEMVEGYVGLHRLGAAHSVEAWRDGQLVGGLYGVCIGSVFCGESMFADESDASKVVFVWAVRHLLAHGLSLVDCQVHTDHLAGLGAREITRRAFLGHLRESGHQDLAPGAWRGPA